MEEKAKQKSDRYLLRFPPHILEIYFLVMTLISLTYVSSYNSEGTLEDSLGLQIGFFSLHGLQSYLQYEEMDFTEICTLLITLILKHHCP